MARLTEVQRGQAIALLMQGQTQGQVAMQFVHCLRETGRLARPRVTTRRQDRVIRLAHLRNRYVTATKTTNNTIGNHNHHIHPKTVRNRLCEAGLQCRRPCVGLPLTRPRHARRMAWLAAHAPRIFPVRQWRQVFFTDESRFTLFHPFLSGWSTS